MTKSLFSVYGYGLGHATRCDAIIKALKGESRVIASENAYDYFTNKGMNPSKINSFKIGSITKSFSWVQTIFENIDLPFNMLADYNLVKRVTREFKPDVIISDTEPVSMLYANTAKVPSHFLSNLIPITEEYKSLPAKLKNTKLNGQEAVIRMFLDQVFRKSNFLLSPTISHYSLGAKVKFTDLIVRKKPADISSVESVRKKHRLPDDFILVSFGGAKISSEYYNLLIPILKEFKDQEFVISTNHAVKREILLQNLRLYPFIDDYLSMLKACKAVICLAGHSTISEALVYGKPCFVIPVQDHVEQLINAFILDKKGYGKAFYHKGDIKESLKDFLNNLDFYARNIKSARFKGNGDSECAKLIEKNLRRN